MSDGYYMRRHPVGPRILSVSDRLRSRLDESGFLDWYDREQTKQQLATAESKERRAKIMNSMFASGSSKAMAEHMADHTDMSAEEAIAYLKLASMPSMPSASKVPTIAERSGGYDLGIGVMTRADGAGGHLSTSWDNVIARVWADRKEKTNELRR